jgi:hypothetical protein
MSAHLAKLTQSRPENIFLVMASDHGFPCFYYISAKNDKVAVLRNLKNGVAVNLSSFGKIICSGYGRPSKSIQAEMEEQYGFIEAVEA